MEKKFYQVKISAIGLINIITCLISLLAILNCGIDYEEKLEEANPRLVPAFVCEGDQIPTTAMWNRPRGVRGAVEIWTNTGEKVAGRLGLRHNGVPINRALKKEDIPLTAKLFHDGDQVGEEKVIYEVLSGPVDVEFKHARLFEVEPKIPFTEAIQMPIFVRCVDAPNELQEANTEFECGEVLDENGNNIGENCSCPGDVNCICPNEGAYLGMKTVEIEIVVPAKQAIVWDVDGTWFGDDIITNSFTYKKGEDKLNISGPGASSTVTMDVGELAPGNQSNPVGLWQGHPQEGKEITTSTELDEDGNRLPTSVFILKLNVSCTEN